MARSCSEPGDSRDLPPARLFVSRISPVTGARRALHCFAFAILPALLFVSSVAAQEARWFQLSQQVVQLKMQGKIPTRFRSLRKRCVSPKRPLARRIGTWVSR